jgi:hypothetical protein
MLRDVLVVGSHGHTRASTTYQTQYPICRVTQTAVGSFVADAYDIQKTHRPSAV